MGHGGEGGDGRLPLCSFLSHPSWAEGLRPAAACMWPLAQKITEQCGDKGLTVCFFSFPREPRSCHRWERRAAPSPAAFPSECDLGPTWDGITEFWAQGYISIKMWSLRRDLHEIDQFLSSLGSQGWSPFQEQRLCGQSQKSGSRACWERNAGLWFDFTLGLSSFHIMTSSSMCLSWSFNIPLKRHVACFTLI